jgi:hypothetical protein
MAAHTRPTAVHRVPAEDHVRLHPLMPDGLEHVIVACSCHHWGALITTLRDPRANEQARCLRTEQTS